MLKINRQVTLVGFLRELKCSGQHRYVIKQECMRHALVDGGQGSQRNEEKGHQNQREKCFPQQTTWAGVDERENRASQPSVLHAGDTHPSESSTLKHSILRRPEPLTPQISIACQRCARRSSPSGTIREEIPQKALSSGSPVLARRKTQWTQEIIYVMFTGDRGYGDKVSR